MTTKNGEMVMSDTQAQPRIPEVGEYVRMYGTLVEVQDVTPPVVKVEDYIFEDTSALIELRINGRRVKQFSTVNNCGGRDSCVQHAIQCAGDEVRRLGKTDAEIVVVKITKRIRMRPTGHRHFYDNRFLEFEWLKCGSCRDLPDDMHEDVWSSKRGDLTKKAKDKS